MSPDVLDSVRRPDYLVYYHALNIVHSRHCAIEQVLPASFRQREHQRVTIGSPVNVSGMRFFWINRTTPAARNALDRSRPRDHPPRQPKRILMVETSRPTG
jgi:hypothetical protein